MRLEGLCMVIRCQGQVPDSNQDRLPPGTMLEPRKHRICSYKKSLVSYLVLSLKWQTEISIWRL